MAAGKRSSLSSIVREDWLKVGEAGFESMIEIGLGEPVHVVRHIHLSLRGIATEPEDADEQDDSRQCSAHDTCIRANRTKRGSGGGQEEGRVPGDGRPYFWETAPAAGQLVSPTRVRFISKMRTGPLPGEIRSPTCRHDPFLMTAS
jgi:hypothetical protein